VASRIRRSFPQAVFCSTVGYASRNENLCCAGDFDIANGSTALLQRVLCSGSIQNVGSDEERGACHNKDQPTASDRPEPARFLIRPADVQSIVWAFKHRHLRLIASNHTQELSERKVHANRSDQRDLPKVLNGLC
jgi:hypothetical protein